MTPETKKILKIIGIVLLSIVGILFIYLTRDALSILITAIFITIIINRPVNFLEQKVFKGKRGLSLSIVILVILAILILSLLTIVPLFIDQLTVFLKSLPKAIDSFEDKSNFINDIVTKYNLEKQFNEIIISLEDYVKSLASNIANISFTAIGLILNFILTSIFVLILVISFVLSGRDYYESLTNKIFLENKNRENVNRIVDKFADIIGDFFVGQSIVAVIASTFLTIVMFILSMVFSFTGSMILPSGLIILIGSFIPIFGALFSVIIVAFLLLFYNPIASLIFILIYIVYQQVEGNVIIPRVQSKKLNMPPVLVIISIIFGIKFIGGVLSIVAIPIGAFVLYLFKEISNFRNEKRDNN